MTFKQPMTEWRIWSTLRPVNAVGKVATSTLPWLRIVWIRMVSPVDMSLAGAAGDKETPQKRPLVAL